MYNLLITNILYFFSHKSNFLAQHIVFLFRIVINLLTFFWAFYFYFKTEKLYFLHFMSISSKVIILKLLFVLITFSKCVNNHLFKHFAVVDKYVSYFLLSCLLCDLCLHQEICLSLYWQSLCLLHVSLWYNLYHQ